MDDQGCAANLNKYRCRKNCFQGGKIFLENFKKGFVCNLPVEIRRSREGRLVRKWLFTKSESFVMTILLSVSAN